MINTGFGNWGNFVSGFTPPINKFPYWVASAMEGSLIAHSYVNQQVKGPLAAEVQLLLNYIAGAPTLFSVAGALAVNSGKVVFQLKQRKLENRCLPSMAQEMPTLNNNLDFLDKPCNCK